MISTKAVILQMLTHGSQYGGQIQARARKASKGRIRLDAGSLYPALHALQQDGYLDVHEEPAPPGRGGRTRRYYRLTKAGNDAAATNRATVAALFKIAGAEPD